MLGLFEIVNLQGVELFGLSADLVAHAFFSALLYVLSRTLRIPGFIAVFLVLGIALGKETYDDSVMLEGSSEWESLCDFTASLCGCISAVFVDRWLNPVRHRGISVLQRVFAS